MQKRGPRRLHLQLESNLQPPLGMPRNLYASSSIQSHHVRHTPAHRHHLISQISHLVLSRRVRRLHTVIWDLFGHLLQLALPLCILHLFSFMQHLSYHVLYQFYSFRFCGAPRPAVYKRRSFHLRRRVPYSMILCHSCPCGPLQLFYLVSRSQYNVMDVQN